MKTLLATTALAALTIMGGCAGSNRTAETGRSQMAVTRTETVAVKPVVVSKPMSDKSATKTIVPTEAKAYAETYDPSGWGGTSTLPNGIGGGPQAAGDDNPYETTETAPASGEKAGITE